MTKSVQLHLGMEIFRSAIYRYQIWLLVFSGNRVSMECGKKRELIILCQGSSDSWGGSTGSVGMRPAGMRTPGVLKGPVQASNVMYCKHIKPTFCSVHTTESESKAAPISPSKWSECSGVGVYANPTLPWDHVTGHFCHSPRKRKSRRMRGVKGIICCSRNRVCAKKGLAYSSCLFLHSSSNPVFQVPDILLKSCS